MDFFSQSEFGGKRIILFSFIDFKMSMAKNDNNWASNANI